MSEHAYCGQFGLTVVCVGRFLLAAAGVVAEGGIGAGYEEVSRVEQTVGRRERVSSLGRQELGLRPAHLPLA